jgi:hypothetical protein
MLFKQEEFYDKILLRLLIKNEKPFSMINILHDFHNYQNWIYNIKFWIYFYEN